MNVFHLFYRSAASSYVADSTIQEILERSRINNAMRNVTGLLLFRAGHFIQLLEGKRADVKLIYDKILKDTRHANAEILLEFESEAAIFPDWSMGYVKDEKVSSDLSKAIDALAASVSLSGNSRETIIQTLRSFNSRDLGSNRG